MKVLHVIPSLAAAHGGPTRTVLDMCRAVAPHGIVCEIATTNDDGWGHQVPFSSGGIQIKEGSTIRYFQKQTEFYKLSLSLDWWLARHVTDYDIVHVHALFSFSSISAGYRARRAGRPYVVDPHGVLNRYGRSRRPILKRISLALLEMPLIRRAAVIRYMTETEQTETEAAGIRIRGVVIPPGIDLSNSSKGGESELTESYSRTPFILFLGRINPVKNLELLIRALVHARKVAPRLTLVIAGDGDKGYVHKLQQLAASLGLADCVTWAGHISGGEKRAALRQALLLVQPSLSESFGVAVVEALAAGVPVVVGEGVGISADISAAEAGLIAAQTPFDLGRAIAEIVYDARVRQKFSENARALAFRKFSLERMGSSLADLYRQVAGFIPKTSSLTGSGVLYD